MRCPKCHFTMQRKEAPGNVYYYECPHCGYSVGKPVEEEAAKETTATETSTNR